MIGVAGLWLGVASQAVAQRRCAELEGAKPQAHLEYLQRDRSTLNPSCIINAMGEISLAIEGQRFDRHTEGVKTLTYLDYRVPDESKLSGALSLNRNPYPASNALSIIGKPVVPALIEAIANSATSDIARSNAIGVIVALHSREDLSEAVRVLRRAAKAKESADWEASQRLSDAAQKTAGMCRGLMTNACMDALYSKDEK